MYQPRASYLKSRGIRVLRRPLGAERLNGHSGEARFSDPVRYKGRHVTLYDVMKHLHCEIRRPDLC